MAGRLRTQQTAIEVIIPKVAALLDDLYDAAPQSVVRLDYLDQHWEGGIADTKVAAWYNAIVHMSQSKLALEELRVINSKRIERSERRKALRSSASAGTDQMLSAD